MRLTLQAAWLLCDTYLPLGDHRLPLGVADVGGEQREAGALLSQGARVVQGQQLPVRRLETTHADNTRMHKLANGT